MVGKNDEILRKIKESVMEYDSEAVIKNTYEALKEGIDPIEILNHGLAQGIKELGELFEIEYFATEMLLAGDAFNEGFNILKPHLIKTGSGKSKGVVVLGVVEGDIHDIGKDFVKTMLMAYGFEVHDLGYDVKSEEFLVEVKKKNADILALSALMSSTMEQMKDIIKEMRKTNPKVKIIIGGGPVTPEVAENYGADGWAISAPDGAKKALELIE